MPPEMYSDSIPESPWKPIGQIQPGINRAVGASGSVDLSKPQPIDLNKVTTDAEATQYNAASIAKANKPLPKKAVGGRFQAEVIKRSTDVAFASSTDWVPASIKSQYDRQQYLETNFPTLLMAQKATGLSDKEVADTTNFALAADAAKKIIQSVDPKRQNALLQSMPPAQQALTLDLIRGVGQAAVDEQAKTDSYGSHLASQIADANADPNVLQRGMRLLGVGVSEALSALQWANDETQHGARSLMGMGAGLSPMDAWHQTAENTYDPKALQYARDTYGDKPVNVIMALKDAHDSGDPDVLGVVMRKYENDPEALTIIDQLVNKLDANQGLQDLVTYIDSANQGDTGNLMAWSIGAMLGHTAGRDFNPYSPEGFEWANSSLFTGTSGAGNVAATFGLDPTIFVSRVNGIYKGLKYGLNGLSAAEEGGMGAAMVARVDKIFEKKGVKNYFDRVLGPQLKAISEETDIGKRAQMFNSVSAQHRRVFKPEALAMMERAGVHDAETARDFIQSGDHITTIFQGQAAKGLKNGVMVPHMTIANVGFKKASMAVRGATWDKVGSARWIDGVFGQGTSQQIANEIAAASDAGARADVVKRVQDHLAEVLSKDGADEQVGEFLSKFQFADGEAKRTFIGRVMDAVTGRAEGKAVERGTGKAAPARFAFARYGYASEGRLDVRTRLERISRLMSHRPDTSNGLYIGDGRDADVVRQVFLAGGVNPYWSNFAKYLWVHSNEAQRKIAANGIARTYGFATGMHVVDPELGRAEIGRMAESMGQKYAPDIVDVDALRKAAKNEAAKQRRAEAAATKQRDDVLSELERRSTLKGKAAAKQAKADEEAIARGEKPVPDLQSLPPIVPARSADDIFEEMRKNAIARNPGQYVDENGRVMNSAVFYSQTEPRVHMPDLAKAEALGIRQSYLQAFLGNNIGVQTMTDIWVLGTLLGPRFQIRSGIEDAAFFGMVGGPLRGWRSGRILSQALREANGQKLGLFKTTSRMIGDRADKAAGLLPNDAAEDVRAIMSGLIVKHLDPEDVRLAEDAMQNGDRKVLIQLLNKATLRRRLAWARGVDSLGLHKLSGRVRRSARQEEDLGYINDIIKYDENPFDAMGEVSETSAHLVDGTMPRSRYSGIEEGSKDRTVFVGGQPHSIRTADGGYTSKEFGHGHVMDTEVGSIGAHQEWLDNLVLVVTKDGVKGRKAVELIKRYHSAVNRKTPNLEAQNKVITELAKVIEDSDTPYLSMMAHAQREGSEGLAKRTLDAVLAMFVDDKNQFNNELYDALVHRGEDGLAHVALSDGGVPRVTVESLRKMRVKPQAVLAPAGIPVLVGDGTTFARAAWDATGRSLARLTREPIFIANYVDARRAIAPLEKVMEERFGKEYAKRWAVDQAQRYSVERSMNYLDNPAIRSNLAWHLRNVARFYRASEDFNRRAVKLMKNHPVGIWKASLGWNMLDDTGFVHEDEFGQKYFVWPGSAIAMRAVNAVTSKIFGQETMAPGADLAWTSGVQMLTPSADPNSWTPTLSGPYSAFAIKGIVRMLPGLNGLETNLFGPYSESQELWRGVIPPNLMRALDLAQTGSKGEEGRRTEAGTPFATFYRQAAQIYALNNPDFENKQWSQEDIAQARSAIDHMSMDLLFFKTLTSPVFPASINSEPITVTDFAKSLGIDGFREGFVQLQRKYYDDPGKAFATWWKMNPDLSPFTVSSTNSNRDMGSYKPFKETVDFIESNPDALKNPYGFSFFSPQTGADSTQQLAAWTYLQRMGVYTHKTTDQTFKEMVTARGYSEYQLMKAQYETLVANNDKTADGRWAAAKQDLFARYPQLESRLRGDFATKHSAVAGDYAGDVEAVREATKYFQAKGNPLADRYAEALAVYDSARETYQQLPANTKDYSEKKADVRKRWTKGFVPQMISKYGDDDQFKSFLYVLSSALGQGFEVN